MPPVRNLLLVSAAAASVPVLCALIGFQGWVPDAAAVVALLAAALAVALSVARPVPRWALTVGILLLAAVPAWRQLTAPSTVDSRQVMDSEYGTAVLLALGAAALLTGIVALPQFQGPVWRVAVACAVALLPVVAVAVHTAAERAVLPPSSGTQAVIGRLAPGLLATGLAGLALVLAAPRTDRRFLLPSGVLLVQVAAAYTTWTMSGYRILDELLYGAEISSAFLEPGLRTDVPAEATASMSLDFEVGAALATAALLAGPLLIATGAATAGPVRAAAAEGAREA